MSACTPIERKCGRTSLGEIDHYTLIVASAEKVARFHEEVLGFELLEVRSLNTGTASPQSYDMVNYIMRSPDHSGRTIVITEGLTEESYFRRHLQEKGPGIHHVAYQVANIDEAMRLMRQQGAHFLSEVPVVDPRSGLKQVFMDVPGGGYTVELIERGETNQASLFQDGNMKELVNGARMILEAPKEVSRVIRSPIADVRALLSDLDRLGEWTGHRTVRCFPTGWREIRFGSDTEVTCLNKGDQVIYRWGSGAASTEFVFDLRSMGSETRVSVDLASFEAGKASALKEILESELLLLGELLGDVCCSVTLAAARLRVDAHARAVMLR